MLSERQLLNPRFDSKAAANEFIAFVFHPPEINKLHQSVGVVAGLFFCPYIIYYSIDGVKKFALKLKASEKISTLLSKSLGLPVGVLGASVNLFFAKKGNEYTFHRLFTLRHKEKSLAALECTSWLYATGEFAHWLILAVPTAGGAAYYTAIALQAWGCSSLASYIISSVPWFFCAMGDNTYLQELWWELADFSPIRAIRNHLRYCAYRDRHHWQRVCELEGIFREASKKLKYSANNAEIDELYQIVYAPDNTEEIIQLHNSFGILNDMPFPSKKVVCLRVLQFLPAPIINGFGNISYYFTGKLIMQSFSFGNFMQGSYGVVIASLNAGMQWLVLTKGVFEKILLKGSDPGLKRRSFVAAALNFIPASYTFAQNIVLVDLPNLFLTSAASVSAYFQTYSCAIYPFNQQIAKCSQPKNESNSAKQQKLADAYENLAKYVSQLKPAILEQLLSVTDDVVASTSSDESSQKSTESVRHGINRYGLLNNSTPRPVASTQATAQHRYQCYLL